MPVSLPARDASGGVQSVAVAIERFLREVKDAWRAHALLQAGGLAVFASGYAVSHITGFLLPASPETFIYKYVLLSAFYVLSALFVFKIARMALVERPPRPALELARWFAALVFDARRWANGIHGTIFVFLLMSGFTMWKNQVARIFSFRWDEALMELDRGLHLGRLPHEWLQPLLGQPLVTALINWNYVLWFPALFASWLVVAFQPERSLLRQRFFYAFLLCWAVGGILFANLLSSAGPVYHARVVGGSDPYTGLFAYLQEVDRLYPLTALYLQELLWTAYIQVPSYSTISAMPSLHVTIATLLFLAARGLGRSAALATGIFAALIGIGSVHLGWHYAVDGYAGVVLALFCWRIADRLARWDLQRAGQGSNEVSGRSSA